MRESDKREFMQLLNDTADYYRTALTTGTIRIYFNGLQDLSIEAVRVALNAHMRDPKAGKFMPKIADLLAVVESLRDDGHLGGQEAWSIAMQARTEAASVVWTEQISAAFFNAALPLLDAGDAIAARMAFLERYEREVQNARRMGIPARWSVSVGADPQQRVQAIEYACSQGRITREHADRLLPAPTQAITHDAMLRIENGVKESEPDPVKQKHRIAQLRAMLKS